MDGVLRLLATRGGRRIALLEPVTETPLALSLGIVEYGPNRVLDGVKSLSYAANMLAARLARERGFDDALLVSADGFVLEGPRTSFFLAVGGRLRTPPLFLGLLDSITRRTVLEVTDVEERILRRDDIAHATGAFLAGTTHEVMPIARIETVELDPCDTLVLNAARLVRSWIAHETRQANP